MTGIERGTHVWLFHSSDHSYLSCTHNQKGSTKDIGHITTTLPLCWPLGTFILILEILQFVYIHREHELPR